MRQRRQVINVELLHARVERLNDLSGPGCSVTLVWGGIELRELETIFVLADELHFGRAAERLGVSTAHVSQTLRHVERRLGGQLFERTSRRVELTLLGDMLVRNLRPVVAELDRQVSEAA